MSDDNKPRTPQDDGMPATLFGKPLVYSTEPGPDLRGLILGSYTVRQSLTIKKLPDGSYIAYLNDETDA